MRRDRSDSDAGTKDFAHYQCGDRGPGELCQPVRHHVGDVHFTPDQDAQRYRRVIMRAGNMAAGVNHHHERCADGERRDHTRTWANSRAANRQDKEESSDEFRDIFVHNLRSYPTQLEKSKTHQQWDLGLIAVRH